MKGPMEYSLAELLEHPVLVVLMTRDGIERRGLDLILDAESGDRRRAKAELHAFGIADQSG